MSTIETMQSNKNSVPLSGKNLNLSRFFAKMKEIRKILEHEKSEIVNDDRNSE
jgi:hypothetical protein